MFHPFNSGSKVGIVLALLGAWACDRPGSTGTGTSPQSSTSPQAIAGPETPLAAEKAPRAQASATQDTDLSGAPNPLDVTHLGDPGLAAILQSLHNRIAQEAQFAATAARAREVKEQAHDASLVHAGAITIYGGLFQRLGIVPRPNPVSLQIDGDRVNAMQALRDSRATTFDNDYLAWQSRALGEALQLSDPILAAAQSFDLRSQVARDRNDLQAQLQTVSRLQQSLNPGVTNLQKGSQP